MSSLQHKIVITGAAGLVGQNLVLYLQQQGYQNLIAIDKHQANLDILKKLNPLVKTVTADLSEKGDWENELIECQALILLHAQITGLDHNEFVKNNLTATQNVLAAMKNFHVPYVVHVSSSVVNSVIEDTYTTTKTEQEKMILGSGIPYCVLRPTLMFGWFDPKHLGWLSRFMEKTALFPVPGHGRYLRQPLYSRDFCKIICAAIEQKPYGKIFDIVGEEQINYVEIIKLIKQTKNLKTTIIKIPYVMFYYLLKLYALFNSKPPFTADQLKALTAGDFFSGVDAKKTFGVTMTPLNQAFQETFAHPIYSKIILER